MSDIKEVIVELRTRLADATPGPWKTGALASYDGLSGAPFRCVYRSDAETADTRIYVWGDSREALLEDDADERAPLFDCDADAALIVAAVNALPALLDHIAELEGRTKALEAMIDRAIDPHHNKPYGSFSDFAWARLEDLTTARQALDAPAEDGGG